MTEYFRAKAYRSIGQTSSPDEVAGPWNEAAEAVEWAEGWLSRHGGEQESFVDVYFNGESTIHTSVYFLRRRPATFGLANSKAARWPVEYEDEGNVFSSEEDFFGRDLDEWKPGDDDEDISEEEDTDEGEDEYEDDFPDEDFEDSDTDDENESENEDENEEEEQEEDEMPRLTIFAKMRGPKGWRKRAESDTARDRNNFALKIGVLNTKEKKPARAERDTKVEIQFREQDSNRSHGELKIHIPDDVILEKKGKWYVANIPYYEEDEDY